MSHVRVPGGLQARRALGPEWAGWLDRLPRRADGLLREWQLTPDGDPTHGYCSLVLPVRDEVGQAAVLKLTFDGDDESEHEPLALQVWGGDGAVRMVRADPGRRALLLERLHRRDLGAVGDVEACEVVADRYRRLHVPAPGRLRPLTAYVERWAGDLAALGTDLPVPRRYVDQALSLAAELVGDPASTGTTVHGDLHYGNVLAADREPWLVIDPKPTSGDPHYEPAPMLSNRFAELADAPGGVRAGIRRRFHALVDAGGLDEARSRAWVVVRMVLDAGWAVQDARRAGRSLTPAEQARVTRCVTVAKAVQD